MYVSPERGLYDLGFALMSYVPAKDIESYNELNTKLFDIASKVGITVKVPVTSRDIEGGYGFDCKGLLAIIANEVNMLAFQSVSAFSQAEELLAYVQNKPLAFNLNKEVTIVNENNLQILAISAFETTKVTHGSLSVARYAIRCLDSDASLYTNFAHGYTRAAVQAELIIQGRSEIVVRSPRELVRAVYALGDQNVDMSDKLHVMSMTRPQRRLLTRAFEHFANNEVYDFALDSKDLKRIFHSLHISELTKNGKLKAIVRLVRQDKCVSFDSDVKKAIKLADQGAVVDLLKLVKKYPNRCAQHLSIMSGKTLLAIIDEVIEKATPSRLIKLMELAKSRSVTGKVYTLPSANNPMLVERVNDKHVSEWTEVYAKLKERVGSDLATQMGLTPTDVRIQPSLYTTLLDKAIIEDNSGVLKWERGNRYKLPVCDTLSLCQWWIGDDVDLSMCMLDSDLDPVYDSTYEHLLKPGCVHSVDVRYAPKGAAEYINITKSELDPSIRYGVMVTSSYDGQTFKNMKESWVGIGDTQIDSTVDINVVNRISVNQDCRNVILAVIDFATNEIIWLDVPYSQSNQSGVTYSGNMVKSYVEMATSLHRTRLTKGDLLEAAVNSVNGELCDDGINFNLAVADAVIDKYLA